MNMQSCTEFSFKKDDRVYSFHVPQGGSYVEVYDVALQLLTHATEKLKEISEKAQSRAPKVIPADEVSFDKA